MSLLFNEVRERVPAIEAARFYGLHFDRKGWALCPFHADKHASVSFRSGRYRCWSCGAHGDAVDLTAHLFGLAPMEAVSRLNTDFGLGLSLGRKATEAEKAEARRQRAEAEERKRFKEWKTDTLNRLACAYRVGFLAKKAEKAPENCTEPEAYAIRLLEVLEDCSERLSHGTKEEQEEIYKERVIVEKWLTNILTNPVGE